MPSPLVLAVCALALVVLTIHALAALSRARHRRTEAEESASTPPPPLALTPDDVQTAVALYTVVLARLANADIKPCLDSEVDATLTTDPLPRLDHAQMAEVVTQAAVALYRGERDDHATETDTPRDELAERTIGRARFDVIAATSNTVP